MDIKIIIEQQDTNEFAVLAGRTTLFTFWYDDTVLPQWRFRSSDNLLQPVIFSGDEFPKDYFYNLSRARFFTEMGVDETPENVTVVFKDLDEWYEYPEGKNLGDLKKALGKKK